MQVLFEDIARTLGAKVVTLPTDTSSTTASISASKTAASILQLEDQRNRKGKSISMARSQSESAKAKGKQPDLSMGLTKRLSTELSRLSLNARRDEFAITPRSKDVGASGDKEFLVGRGLGLELERGIA
jgi:hypothetical protein